MNSLKIVLTLLALLIASESDANVRVFSRSCKLEELPPQTKWILSRSPWHQKVGGVPIDQIDYESQRFVYAFESITTDYFQYPRYWLRSVGATWTVNWWNKTYSVKTWPASRWVPESAWDNNRTWFMSVRSGSGNSTSTSPPENIRDIWMPVARNYDLKYGQVGGHWFYDSPGGRMFALPDSYATDCNCWDFGFGWSLFSLPTFSLHPWNVFVGIVALCKP